MNITHNISCRGDLHHSIGKVLQVRWGNIIGDISKQEDLIAYIANILLEYPTLEEFEKAKEQLAEVIITADYNAQAILKNRWDINQLQSITTEQYLEIENKVDKVDGYGLSKNDLSDVLKALYDDAVVKAHIHENKAFLDSLTSLKTINGETIIGDGNIEVKGGSEKPEGGWQKTDLSNDVQVSLDKAEQWETDKPYYITASEISEQYPTKEEVEALVTPTTPNIIKFGDLDVTDGQMSNFSSTNYAQFPFLVDLTDKVFTIVMEVTTSADVTTQQNILDSQDGLAFAVRNGQLVLAVSNNGTQWAFEAVGGTILPNTTYYIRLGWDKAIYKVLYSTDNDATWVEAISHNSTLSPYPRTMLIGKDTTDRYIFKGSINLNKCTLAINGQYVWDGMTDAGLLTRLDTSLSNIDANGIEYIKSIAPTPKEWYGTQAEFEALEEYTEGMNYYIIDDGTTPTLTSYMIDDMAIPTFDANFENGIATEIETFDAPLDEDIITEEDNKDA